MFCIQCGNKLPEGSAFCPACGARVSGETAPVQTRFKFQTLTCPACGSNHLKRIRAGVYLCEHCGTKVRTEGPESHEDAETEETALALLLAEADEHAGKGALKNELLCLTKACALAPEDAALLYRIGRCYSRLDFPDRAMEYYRKAQALTPEDPAIPISMGTAMMNKGDCAQAKLYYEKSLSMAEADPSTVNAATLAVAYAGYGLCLGRLGDRKGAANYFSFAEEKGFDPDTLGAYYRELNLKHPL